MSGGLGFTLMMKSLSKTNRGYLKHVDKYKTKKDEFPYLKSRETTHCKEFTEKELEDFRLKLQRESQIETRKNLVINGIVILFVFFLIVIFLIT